MREPIIFLVDNDVDTLGTVAAALDWRFGLDYRILTESSPSAALSRLAQACEDAEPVALVIAGVATPEMTALDWLEQVHDLCPSAARCALVSYGDGPTYPVVRHALVRGHVDSFLLKPLGNPEDRLYPVVAEILGSWSRSTQPAVPLVTIVGERWAPRSHELRDMLERASVPYQFCACDSDEGRGALQRAGHT